MPRIPHIYIYLEKRSSNSPEAVAVASLSELCCSALIASNVHCIPLNPDQPSNHASTIPSEVQDLIHAKKLGGTWLPVKKDENEPLKARGLIGGFIATLSEAEQLEMLSELPDDELDYSIVYFDAWNDDLAWILANHLEWEAKPPPNIEPALTFGPGRGYPPNMSSRTRSILILANCRLTCSLKVLRGIPTKPPLPLGYLPLKFYFGPIGPN